MKYLFVFSLALLFTSSVPAQSKNPTTTKETQDKIKQAQQQLDNLTPEQKKMMEQMGISTKTPSLPTGATDADINAAVGGEFGGVPGKNAALIAAIPKITLTSANMATYLADVNKYIVNHLSFEGKTSGEYFYKGLKSNNYTTLSIANTATGLWASGQLETAIYMLGKTAADDVKNTDNLSNLAAMLSMAGAPHMAIPLLEYLNKLFPGNSTILNNLGQAWFYMGVIDKADTYLQQTIRAFAYHPQANQTECLIQQSKGNTAKAVEHMKNSLKYSYSLDKLNTLRKLGYSVKGNDMHKPFRPDPDPLGLRSFTRPGYPKNYDEEVQLKYVWDNFQKDIENKMQLLNKALQPLINLKMQQAQNAFDTISRKNMKNLSSTSAGPSRLYQQNAQRNLNDMGKDGGQEYRLKIAKKKVDDLIKSFQSEKDKARRNFEKQFSTTTTQETELAKKGENIGYDICKVNRAYSEWVYKNYNQPLEQAYNDYLHQLRLKTEEELYWKQFIQEENDFAATQINAKKEWLVALSASRYLETAYITANNVCPAPVPDKEKRVKLGDFDDMHCKYHSALNFGLGNKIETHCNKLVVTFDAKVLSGNLNYKSDKDGVDRFVSGTIEATVINKEVSANAGPLQAGASVKAGVGVEISRNGIEDVYVTGEAGVKVGSSVVDDPAGIVNNPSVEITASGKISLISGNMSGGISGFGPK